MLVGINFGVILVVFVNVVSGKTGNTGNHT